jgi:hypothetical protein
MSTNAALKLKMAVELKKIEQAMQKLLELVKQVK